jgi:WD40 repeat protein
MTFSKDGTIFVRDVIDGGPVVQLEGDGQPIRRASFSSGPGTLRVIAACEDGSARIWHVFPLAGARARKPRELYEWEVAREIRLAKPLEYR